MNKPTVTFAINRRDDSAPYFGRQLKGFATVYPTQPRSWTFFADMLSDDPWDIGELPFSHYLAAVDAGRPIIGVPAFQLRFLPHAGIVVADAARIEEAADFRGRRVGSADWAFNPAVWQRGVLQDQYGVDLSQVEWYESESTPSFPGWATGKPDKVRSISVAPNLAFSQKDAYGMPTLLSSGKLDGLLMAGMGRNLPSGTHCLFDDPMTEAAAFVRRYGFAPINTMFVISRKAAARYPSLALSLMELIRETFDEYGREIEQKQHSNYTYVPLEFAKKERLYPFPQGFEQNRAAIDAMLRYCVEQEIIQRTPGYSEVFLESCL